MPALHLRSLLTNKPAAASHNTGAPAALGSLRATSTPAAPCHPDFMIMKDSVRGSSTKSFVIIRMSVLRGTVA
jgi:hypothetical protein